jgi:hypothetical protein
VPLLRKFRPDAKDEHFLKPAAIADAFCYVAHQDRSVWTMNSTFGRSRKHSRSREVAHVT